MPGNRPKTRRHPGNAFAFRRRSLTGTASSVCADMQTVPGHTVDLTYYDSLLVKVGRPAAKRWLALP